MDQDQKPIIDHNMWNSGNTEQQHLHQQAPGYAPQFPSGSSGYPGAQEGSQASPQGEAFPPSNAAYESAPHNQQPYNQFYNLPYFHNPAQSSLPAVSFNYYVNSNVTHVMPHPAFHWSAGYNASQSGGHIYPGAVAGPSTSTTSASSPGTFAPGLGPNPESNYTTLLPSASVKTEPQTQESERKPSKKKSKKADPDSEEQPKKKMEKCMCSICLMIRDPRTPDFRRAQLKLQKHVCDECGRQYGKTSHLKAHERGHRGERPYACQWKDCTKRFTRSDELSRHEKTHTGVKNFECKYVGCEKRFARSDHRAKHMKTHERKANAATRGRKPKAAKAKAALGETSNSARGQATARGPGSSGQTDILAQCMAGLDFKEEQKENIPSGAFTPYPGATLPDVPGTSTNAGSTVMNQSYYQQGATTPNTQMNSDNSLAAAVSATSTSAQLHQYQYNALPFYGHYNQVGN